MKWVDDKWWNLLVSPSGRRDPALVAGEWMRKSVIIGFLTFFLVSCGADSDQESGTWAVEKQDFFIETSFLWDFPKAYTINKTGRLNSTQNVQLSANAAGRVQNIKVKEGQKVSKGQLLATLSDNIWNYNINVEKASNAISRAKLNYDSQKILLDKQIADAELNIARLSENLINLEKTNAQNIQRNENDQTNINAAESLARIDLNIEKINQNIEKINQNVTKLEFDATNQEIANDETLNGFKTRIQNEQNSLRLSLDDIIEFSDEILWITEKNRNENDDFERYLWARDKVQLTESENSLRALIAFRNGEFESFVPDDLLSMTEDQMRQAISTGERWYALVKQLLADLETTFQNSLVSSRNLSEQQIDAYIGTINGYQASTQGSYTWFISLKNQIESFLKTYENTEDSTRKQIALLKTDIDILKKEREIAINDRLIQEKNLNNAEKNLELWLESTITQGSDAITNLKNQLASAELNYKNAKDNRSVTLKTLNNQIQEANINYNQAIRERAKLSIYAPISGTISSVDVDLWQEVGNGWQLFQIQNTSNSEISIWLSDDELELVKVWTKLAVEYDGKAEKAEIFSISDVADDNLNYKAIIKLSGDGIKLWEIVRVYIPVKSQYTLIPLNIVKVSNDGTNGQISLYDGENDTFKTLRVELGNSYAEQIQVRSCENLNTDVIQQEFIPCEAMKNSEVVTSNISNFDENKFTIVRKK